jgi:ABC-type transporter Mla maintaining outer membrane lipid asymmetry ATPase subunit MlaF
VALASFVDEIAFLYRGRIIYRGPAKTIADAPHSLVRQFVRGDLQGPLDEGKYPAHEEAPESSLEMPAGGEPGE